jgi:hypothetical protein
MIRAVRAAGPRRPARENFSAKWAKEWAQRL